MILLLFLFIPTKDFLSFSKLKKKCYRSSRLRNNLIIMSVSSNRAVCARRLVQEKLCNLLFNNNQKCVTVKRNFGTTNLPQTTSSFMKIYQGNNKFGSFINSIKHNQVSCQLTIKLKS